MQIFKGIVKCDESRNIHEPDRATEIASYSDREQGKKRADVHSHITIFLDKLNVLQFLQWVKLGVHNGCAGLLNLL